MQDVLPTNCLRVPVKTRGGLAESMHDHQSTCRQRGSNRMSQEDVPHWVAIAPDLDDSPPTRCHLLNPSRVVTQRLDNALPRCPSRNQP